MSDKENLSKEHLFSELLRFFGDKSTPFILLIASFILVYASIKFDRYSFEAFSTLVYALGATYLIIFKNRESGAIKKWFEKKWFLIIYLILFVGWFISWGTIVVVHLVLK